MKGSSLFQSQHLIETSFDNMKMEVLLLVSVPVELGKVILVIFIVIVCGLFVMVNPFYSD